MNVLSLSINQHLESFAAHGAAPLPLLSRMDADVLELGVQTARLLRMGVPKVQWAVVIDVDRTDLSPALNLLGEMFSRMEEPGETFLVQTPEDGLRQGSIITFTRREEPWVVETFFGALERGDQFRPIDMEVDVVCVAVDGFDHKHEAVYLAGESVEAGRWTELADDTKVLKFLKK